jgi:hypothetical protein
MADKKSSELISAFHSDLADLLKKYDVHPEDGKVLLVTSDLTFKSGGITGCKPECIMHTPVKHPDGTTTWTVWCGC